MVSTRGYKYKFNIGEKVLCYEPDLTKAKVLYDSKVMEIIETKDRKGKKIVEYLIHFKGWNSSWDRRVNENLVLKDTDANRQLQKDLAEKSQLQIGAYLYRKDRKKRSRLMSSGSTDPKRRFRGSSEDGSCCSTTTAGGREDGEDGSVSVDPEDAPLHSPIVQADVDTESYSSSVESANEDDRVYLHLGEKLKNFLEFDFCQITKHNKLVDLPAKLPVVTILENFVKQVSIQSIIAPLPPEHPRRRNSAAKGEKREKDYEKISTSISIRKEVADGLRVYFIFTLKDYLIYKQEREQTNHFLSDEFVKNFTFSSPEQQSSDMFCIKQELPIIPETPECPSSVSSQETQNDDSRRRLRSYKNEEADVIFDIALNPKKSDSNCLSSIGSGSSGSSTPHANNTNSSTTAATISLRTRLPQNIGITTKAKELLEDVLAWRMLPLDTPTEASMIYGATHLARLIVKLPEFLNASTIPDDKLKLLLQHLDTFIAYLEDHPEWFNDEQYKRVNEIDSDEDKLANSNCDMIALKRDIQKINKLPEELTSAGKDENI